MLLPHLSHLRQKQHLLCLASHHNQQGHPPIPLLHHFPLLLLWLCHCRCLSGYLRPRFGFLDWYRQVCPTQRTQVRCCLHHCIIMHHGLLLLHPSLCHSLEPSNGQEAQIHPGRYPESWFPVSQITREITFFFSR